MHVASAYVSTLIQERALAAAFALRGFWLHECPVSASTQVLNLFLAPYRFLDKSRPLWSLEGAIAGYWPWTWSYTVLTVRDDLGDALPIIFKVSDPCLHSSLIDVIVDPASFKHMVAEGLFVCSCVCALTLIF